MKKLLTISLLALFCLTISGVHEAEAKRFGGGSSFGKSFNNRAAPAPRTSAQKQAAPSKQGAASPARGGMMGMLGGLALGGLLSAMFFGGAFDGINMFDILILAGIGLAIFWFMRRKVQHAAHDYAYTGPTPNHHEGQHDDAFTASNTAPQSSAQSSAQPSTPSSAQMARPAIDEAHFISAAKDIFIRMQTAWDNKNMADIHTFCTTEIANKVAADLEILGTQKNRTEVGMLNAELLDSWIESNDEWVAIHFTALLNEETLSESDELIERDSHEVNETWIFRHSPTSNDPTWYLAGIQQSI